MNQVKLRFEIGIMIPPSKEDEKSLKIRGVSNITGEELRHSIQSCESKHLENVESFSTHYKRIQFSSCFGGLMNQIRYQLSNLNRVPAIIRHQFVEMRAHELVYGDSKENGTFFLCVLCRLVREWILNTCIRIENWCE